MVQSFLHSFALFRMLQLSEICPCHPSLLQSAERWLQKVEPGELMGLDRVLDFLGGMSGVQSTPSKFLKL